MKMQGTLEVDGVRLTVDIEAPDDATDLYVTNVHPNCLVIPKERWRIEHMGLSDDATTYLHHRGIHFLGQLVNGGFKLVLTSLDDSVANEVHHSLERIRDMALLFETEQAANHTPPVDSPELDVDISVLALSKFQEQSLRKNRGVNTLRDVVQLGKNSLLMTQNIDQKAVDKIEEALRRVGATISA
jgi:hypothetical protein